MFSRKLLVPLLILVMVLVISACAPAAVPAPQPTSAPAATTAPAETTAPGATAAPAEPTAAAEATTAAEPTAAATTEAASGGTLRVGQVGNLASLEAYRFALTNYIFLEQVFDQLLNNDKGTNLTGEALESYELAPDNMSVTVKLREGMTSHDGSPVDAEMLKWDLDTRVAPASGEVVGQQQFLPIYAGSEVVDPLTLRIDFKSPVPHATDLLAILALADPDMFVKEDGTVALLNQEDKLIGSGPFRFVEYVPGDHLTLERNPDYWEEGVPSLDRIEIRIFGDNASMIAALEADEIDMAFRPAYQDAARLKEDPRFTVWTPETFGLVGVLMVNPNTPALQDKRVRQAINLAIDRTALNDVAYSGMALPTGSFVPETSIAYGEELDIPLTGDAEAASALLSEAGVTNPTIQLTYDAADEAARLQAELIAANLQAIGFTVNLDPVETSVFNQRRTSQQFETLISILAGTNVHPAGLQNSFVFATQNNPFFKDQQPQEFLDYQEAFNEGMAATDAAAAGEAWQRALQAIKEGAWADALAATPLVVITNNRVKGYTWTESDKPVFKYITIEE
jgi:peptide/nickel transport system substrate-binding protein